MFVLHSTDPSNQDDIALDEFEEEIENPRQGQGDRANRAPAANRIPQARARAGGNQVPNIDQQVRQRNPQDGRDILEAFENLRVTAQPSGVMFLYHYYVWREAVPEDEVASFSNVRLKRLTIDLLLPGPTSLEQIEAQIMEDQKTVKIKYKPPATFLSHRRTAVRTAMEIGAQGRQVEVMSTYTSAMERVNAHRDVLESMSDEQKHPTTEIDLPFRVDPVFCRRDDFGVENARHGIDIGVYRHEDVNFRASNQYVWILNLEMTSVERPRTSLTAPRNIGLYADHA